MTTKFFSFECRCCGAIHEGAPSFSFDAPLSYNSLSDELRAEGHLGTDLCWYEDDGVTHRFIRVCLEIPILGVSEPFMWGVWVSLSEQSFNRYIDTSESPFESDSYFGWLSNRLPYYPDTYALKTNVRPRLDGIRPFIELQPVDHTLFDDYANGISVERAQTIAEFVMHREP